VKYTVKLNKWAVMEHEDRLKVQREMDLYTKNDKNRFLWADLQWALMEWRKYKRAVLRATEEQNWGAKSKMQQEESEWYKQVQKARRKLTNWKENLYGDEEDDDDDRDEEEDEDTEE
jgi:hypothetical protein